MADNIKLNIGYDGESLATWEDTDNDDRHLQYMLQPEVGPVKPPFAQYFDATGDGSGATTLDANGSVTAVLRQLIPASNKIYRVHEIVIVLADNAAFEGSTFGAVAALTTGCTIVVTINGTAYSLCEDAIKSNAHLAAICGEFTYHGFATDRMGIFRMKLKEPIRLSGEDSDKIVFTINDDLTGLEPDSYVFARGVVEK